jgi:uncharacterized membrane protein YecN with MAPEG domain
MAMTVPMWMLLGFATWTFLLMSGTVGVYRWTRILSGRASVSSFPGDKVEGEDWYRRSMRAHANCVENLPVFGAIVLVLYVAGVGGRVVRREGRVERARRNCASLRSGNGEFEQRE